MRLVIAGGARCVWEDFSKAHKDGDHIMAVNHVALFIPQKIRHISSMHAEVLGPLREFRSLLRAIRGGPRDIDVATHSCYHANGVDYVYSGYEFHGGSSGCFAAVVGLQLGYDEIVLCGCPADDTGNFYDPPHMNDDFTAKREVWKKAAEGFGGKVKSMSGWTKELLA